MTAGENTVRQSEPRPRGGRARGRLRRLALAASTAPPARGCRALPAKGRAAEGLGGLLPVLNSVAITKKVVTGNMKMDGCRRVSIAVYENRQWASLGPWAAVCNALTKRNPARTVIHLLSYSNCSYGARLRTCPRPGQAVGTPKRTRSPEHPEWDARRHTRPPLWAALCPPPISCLKVLIPKVTVFGHGALREVTEVK